MEQTWDVRQPGGVLGAAGGWGVELHELARGVQHLSGHLDVAKSHCLRTGQPRGRSLFAHLANTPTRLLLLAALRRVKLDPVMVPPANVSHITGTKTSNTHKPLNDATKATAPKVIVDDGYVDLLTHYPAYGDGPNNNKCWVKQCKAIMSYNLITGEVVRNSKEHLGSQCNVDEYLRSKKKSDIADIEVRLSETVQDEPFLKNTMKKN